MAASALIVQTRENAIVDKLHSAPKRGVDIRLSYKATAKEITEQQVKDLLDFVIEDLNKGWKAEFNEPKAFKTELTQNNVQFVNFKRDKEGNLTFELAFTEVEFAGPVHQTYARQSVLRTLNQYIPKP